MYPGQMRCAPHVRHDWKTSSSNCLRGIQIGNLNHLHWFPSHEAVTATFEKTKQNYTSVMNYESWLKTRVCVWSKLFSWLSITSDSLFYRITSSQNLKYCRRLKKKVSVPNMLLVLCVAPKQRWPLKAWTLHDLLRCYWYWVPGHQQGMLWKSWKLWVEPRWIRIVPARLQTPCN